MTPRFTHLPIAIAIITVLVSSHVSSTAQDIGAARSAKKKSSPAKFAWVNPLPKDHHPALKHATFHSPSMNIDVGYAIMLPPSYDQAGEKKRCPVVYYLHGGRPGSEAKSVRLVDTIYPAMQGDDAIAESIYVFVNGGPVSHYNMPDQPDAQGPTFLSKN